MGPKGTALWPADKNMKLAAGDPGFYQRILREHWAYQPVKTPTVPEGVESNPIDRYVNSKKRAAGIAGAKQAEPHVLARRAAYVLTGLPPRAQELRTFLGDPSPAAFERFIDSLLASPHFGERWARHWMDVVRFAETYGYEWNFEITWRLAVSRLSDSSLQLRSSLRSVHSRAHRRRPSAECRVLQRMADGTNPSLATAFYRLGEMGHDNCNQFPEIRTDVVDNQIDTLTKAFQGVTVSCARCHDHKIDPIPTEDYYALYGVLNSSRPVTRTIDLSGPDEATRERHAEP